MRRSFYNLPIDQLAMKFEVPEEVLLKRLLEEREKEGSVLREFTFLKNRPVSLVPREKAVAAMEIIAELADEIKNDLVNPLEL